MLSRGCWSTVSSTVGLVTRSFNHHVSVRSIVTLQYDDLVAGKDVSEDILQAYGPDGLGALTIAGIPGYAEARRALIPMSHKLAHLSDEEKAKLEHEESMWNTGWSHGREKLGDEPDFAKGSFYANPIDDQPGTPELRQEFPFFYPPNLWPTGPMPELEPAFKGLGRIMFDATVLLCSHIDKLSQARVESYQQHLLHANIKDTRKVKGRLLYYYPANDSGKEDGWIGWHNDSGFLTALTSDMFFDDDTGKIIDNPDPEGGLWIVDRSGGSIKVDIPDDELAVQCGECLQVITGGLLVATPHAVRASKPPAGQRIARSSFPVFIDTEMNFPLAAPEGVSRDAVISAAMDSKVPPLADRWDDGDKFGDFLGRTFKMYYEWATTKK